MIMAPEHITLVATFRTSGSYLASISVFSIAIWTRLAVRHTICDALLISRQISLGSWFSSMALCSCCTMHVKASPVQWPALNPN